MVEASMEGSLNINLVNNNLLTFAVCLVLKPENGPAKRFEFGLTKPLQDGVNVLSQDIAFLVPGYGPIIRTLYAEVVVEDDELKVLTHRI